MPETRIPFYPHRQNRDGSIDCICPRCFAIVATAENVTELHTCDKQHTCDTAFLAERGVLTPPSAASYPLHRETSNR